MTQPRRETAGEARRERLIASIFGLAAVAGVVLLVLYAMGGQTQLEGLLLTVCLGGIGAGIVLWAQWLLPNDVTVEPRHHLPPEDPTQEAVEASSPEDAGQAAAEAAITRRTLLIRALGAAFAGLAAALAIPVLSLGPGPGESLFQTPWRRGLRLVGVDGQPVNAANLPLDGVVTVFPEGLPGSADGQAVLVHVDPSLLDLPPDRGDWAPQGFVCYSKVCTHAGCPVGLYRAQEHRLLCPCHQSTFDVLDGATPVFGPAARPLPQLPISLGPDGTFVAQGDFSGPVGPSFWDIRLHSEGAS
ncbi:MAG TPA: Rieske 2Fe-2S domain-containing protein [Candidatus Limnocylindrales bacterium]|nr:Rieske 2Fe-2S domain-containing protein [Candidatus Limnocylindrales bacterium]